jgi:predicted enzyme related to lactoylglutathione lyase
MLAFKSLLLFAEDAKKLTEFYKKVFNIDPSWSEGDWAGFDLGGAAIAIGPHDKVKGKNKNPERIMFNLDTKDVKGEFERIKGYGTKVIAEPYSMGGEDAWLATFEDPEGNYFQLATPWKS